MAAGKARLRNPEGTRTVILEVAARIFASRGFVGISMRDISDASGINKPVIYHHFGSKEGLYVAVKQNLAAGCDRQNGGIDRADERPADLRAEVWRLYETIRDNESLLRISTWSRLETGSTRGQDDMRFMKALRRRLELAQEQRIIRSNIDPGNLTIMLVALVAFWLEGRSNADGVVEGGPDDPAYLRQAIAPRARAFTALAPPCRGRQTGPRPREDARPPSEMEPTKETACHECEPNQPTDRSRGPRGRADRGRLRLRLAAQVKRHVRRGETRTLGRDRGLSGEDRRVRIGLAPDRTIFRSPPSRSATNTIGDQR